MAMAAKGGGSFDVDSVLNFEKRSGIKDGEIENFITKVDAVNAAIQAMKDGEVDPADVHVDGVPTIEEERQMNEDKRRKRLELAKREKENRERQKRQENEKWWRGAELLYGERKQLCWADAVETSVSRGSASAGPRGNSAVDQTPPSARSLTEGERARLKERYSMEYSRWETWTPSDPATLAELKEREEEEDQKRSKEFEESNADFCKQMMDDMKSRSEARRMSPRLRTCGPSSTRRSEKKESAATTARLKGNRFYKAKRWERALEMYMTSLKAKPYAVNTLANVAQTFIKLERWPDAVEFCDRALHVDGKCVKARSRRASAFVKLAGECPTPLDRIVNTEATAVAAAAAPIPIEVEVEVGSGGSVDVSSPTAAENANGSVSPGGDGGEPERDDRARLRKRYGGRDGLMALALLDLEAAVEADPDGEDVRRQRDALRQEIEEEKAEAAVMNKVRQESRRPADGDEAMEPGGPDPSVSPDVASKTASATESGIQGGHRPADFRARASPTISSEGEDDVGAIDGLLEEALGTGRKYAQGLERVTEAMLAGERLSTEQAFMAALQQHPLLRLTSILEDSPTARVYFRASGGLARLAGATATASHCWDDSLRSAAGADRRQDKPEARASASTSPCSAAGSTEDGRGAASRDDGDERDDRRAAAAAAAAPRLGEDRATFALMLRAVSAALKGGERLAQTEVSKSGLLGAPCARAMRATFNGVRGDEAEAAGAMGMGMAAAAAAAAAGASALLLSRVVDDISVRGQVARSADLLSGLVGLIGAGSLLPPDVESAAAALRAVLIGRTAPIAAKTLTDAAAATTKAAPGAAAAAAAERTGAGWPATIVGETLLLWKEGGGLMQGAPASTGCALCGVLANLATHEEFRGSFANPFSPGATAAAGSGNGGKASTVAGVLVLVAGDTTAERSEARVVALAALVNACLRKASVQAATFSAGGLALALATLSLEGDQRARFVPPLLAARSAGLLARLCALPAALEAMARPGAVDRIVRAIVRSSSLGGNLLDGPAPPASHPNDAAAAESDPVEAVAATAAARVNERENLVRTLGSILRSKPPTSNPAAGDGVRKVGPAAPSSNVPPAAAAVAAVVPGGARAHLLAAAESLGLAGALVSFLPPARRDGAEGVTIASVALRPEWCAPAAVTANACVCLLHLLDGELAGCIAEQVVAADGIPRLISLFANSGGEGGALSARTNAAICLAKLAREPRHKKMIADLRGMEMLVQAGITVNLLELVKAFPNYEDPDRVRNDVLDLSKPYKTLVPKRGSVDLGSGRVELLTLHGTFPMIFRGVAYHTPVQIYVTEKYPASPPLCYIVPTPGRSCEESRATRIDSSWYWQLFATPASTTPTKTSKKRGTVEVVCPNYGRTGSTTMQAALQILGFGPCYHMENIYNLHIKSHPQLWLDGFQGRGLALDKILDGYKSVCDWPVASFYKEILAANPDAKVVMTQRDVDSWWKSLYATIHRGGPCMKGWGLFFMEVLFSDFRLAGHMSLHIKTCSMGEEEAKADYTRHNAEVLAHVNPDRLLKFSPTEGWEPLCKFLGVPVPDVPFPHMGSTKDLKAEFRSYNIRGWVLMATTVTIAGASVAAASFYGGKRAGGALAATEAVVLAARFRKAFAMRPAGHYKVVLRPLVQTRRGIHVVLYMMALETSAKRGGSVRVVCPSYGKTGTMSMQAALEILGFGPCYHMNNVFMLHIKDHPQLWLDGFQGRGLAVDRILDGYTSVVDWPVANFYKDVLAANPDAKVVVAQRDADAWWESLHATIHRGSPCWKGWGVLFLEVLFADIRLANHMALHIKACSMSEEEAKADYARHNQEVLEHVDPDKLLKFSVTEGWEPLCKFLGVPVPDVPFPHIHSTKEQTAAFRRHNIMGWVLMATAITVAGVSVAAASFYGGKRAGGALAATEALVLADRFRQAFAMRHALPPQPSPSLALTPSPTTDLGPGLTPVRTTSPTPALSAAPVRPVTPGPTTGPTPELTPAPFRPLTRAPSTYLTPALTPAPAPTPTIDTSPPQPSPSLALTPSPTTDLGPGLAPVRTTSPTPALSAAPVRPVTPGPTADLTPELTPAPFRPLTRAPSTYLTPVLTPVRTTSPTPALTSVPVRPVTPGLTPERTPAPFRPLTPTPTISPTPSLTTAPFRPLTRGPTTYLTPALTQSPAPTPTIVTESPSPAPTHAPPPAVADTCDSYVDVDGITLCPPGFSPVDGGVSCDKGAVCSKATCCEEVPDDDDISRSVDDNSGEDPDDDEDEISDSFDNDSGEDPVGGDISYSFDDDSGDEMTCDSYVDVKGITLCPPGFFMVAGPDDDDEISDSFDGDSGDDPDDDDEISDSFDGDSGDDADDGDISYSFDDDSGDDRDNLDSRDTHDSRNRHHSRDSRDSHFRRHNRDARDSDDDGEQLDTCASSHHPGPDHSSPEHSSSVDSSPNHGSPDHSSADHSCPDNRSAIDGSSDHSKPNHGNPDDTSPDYSSPNHVSPDHSSPDHSSAIDCSSNHGSPIDGIADHGSTDHTSPVNGNPVDNRPHYGGPDDRSPIDSTSNHGMADHSRPDHSSAVDCISKHGSPIDRIADHSSPDDSSPIDGISDHSSPDHSSPVDSSPDDSSSNHGSSNYDSPIDGRPNDDRPDYGDPDDGSSNHGLADHSSPINGSSNHGIPYNSIPDDTNADHGSSDHSSPDDSSPDHSSAVDSSSNHGSSNHGSPFDGIAIHSSPVDSSSNHGSPDNSSPDDTSPEHSSPIDGSSNHGSPIDTSPDHSSPIDSSSTHGSPIDSSSTHGSPIDGIANHSSPDHGSPDNSSAVDSSPDHGSPIDRSSNHGSPDHSSADNSCPDHSSPIDSSSNHGSPIDGIANHSSPDHSSPVDSSSNHGSPDHSSADNSCPDHSSPVDSSSYHGSPIDGIANHSSPDHRSPVDSSSNHGSPDHSSPINSSSDHSSPVDSSPDHSSPDHISSNHDSSNHGSPFDGIAIYSSPDHSSPVDSSSNHGSADNSSADNSCPDYSSPDHSSPVHGSSNHGSPLDGIANHSSPDHRSPDHSSPIDGIANHSSPIDSSSDHSSPDDSSPDHSSAVDRSSNHGSSNHGSPDHSSPIDSSSDHSSPDDSSSYHGSPFDGIAIHSSSNHGSSNHGSPFDGIAIHSSPDHSSPVDSSPIDGIANHSRSYDTSPDQSSPVDRSSNHGSPNKSSADNSCPDHSSPVDSSSNHGSPIDGIANHSSPDHGSPDHSSPVDSSSDHSSPIDGIANHGSPDHSSAVDRSSNHGSSNHGSPDHSSSNHGSPDHSSSVDSSPDENSPDDNSPDHSSPVDSSSNHSSPDHSSPDHRSPVVSSSNHGSPDYSSPDHSSPDHSSAIDCSSNHGSPIDGIANHSSPDHSSPDHSSSNHGSPDHSSSVDSSPDENSPDDNSPDHSSPVDSSSNHGSPIDGIADHSGAIDCSSNHGSPVDSSPNHGSSDHRSPVDSSPIDGTAYHCSPGHRSPVDSSFNHGSSIDSSPDDSCHDHRSAIDGSSNLGSPIDRIAYHSSPDHGSPDHSSPVDSSPDESSPFDGRPVDNRPDYGGTDGSYSDHGRSNDGSPCNECPDHGSTHPGTHKYDCSSYGSDRGSVHRVSPHHASYAYEDAGPCHSSSWHHPDAGPFGSTPSDIASRLDVTPAATVASGATSAPIVTVAPATTPAPGSALVTDATVAPEVAGAPQAIAEPGATSAPIVTVAAAPTLAPGSTLAPDATLAPEATAAPQAIAVPGPTSSPVVTVTPARTWAPGSTLAPDATVAPKVTMPPRATVVPGATPVPVITVAPATTSAPASTFAPEVTLTPEATTTPQATTVPEATFAPIDTVAPVTTSIPGLTLAPDATLAPEVAAAPQATTVPGSTSAPIIVEAPATTSAPGSTLVPDATIAPEATATPRASVVLEPVPVITAVPATTSAPGVTVAPGATVAPEATVAPQATFAPEATFMPIVTVAPATATADDSTLTPQGTLAPGATEAPIITVEPGTSVAPSEAAQVSDTTLAPEAISQATSTVSPGAEEAPETSLAPVSNRDLSTSSPAVSVVDEVPSPGTLSAEALSILALIGALVVSIGSLFRSNLGNGSGSSGDGPRGSSGDVSRSLSGRLSALAPVGGTRRGETRRRVTKRRPSATLAFVLMTQLQFLATLSLVDYTVREDSWLADFITGLRWINLWWPTDVAEDLLSPACDLEAGSGDLGTSVFVGNLLLVLGVLLGVLLLHVAVVSGVEAFWLLKIRAQDDLDKARRLAVPIGELHARLRGATLMRRTVVPPLASQVSGRQSPVDEEPDNNDEEEGGGRGLVPTQSLSRLSPVARCRAYSKSAWLHFPHIELIILFFTFEGMVASLASAMRHSGCSEVIVTASAVVGLYPLLIFVTMFRTLYVRIRPNVLVVFKPFDADFAPNDSAPNSAGGLLSRFKTSWTEDYSLFSWADRGQWETVETENSDVRRKNDWFRIGFEPMFADYTQRGAWFVVISLVEWASIALVAVLMDDSVAQLLAFCCIHSVIVINTIAACMMAIDAVCMALLAAAALEWEGTDEAEHSSTAVVVLQLFCLCVLIIPVYVDAVTIMIGAMRSRRAGPAVCPKATVIMAPGKRKAPSSPGSRPAALAAPGSPRFLPCPICGKSFVARIVHEHAWSCPGAPASNEDTGGDGKSDAGNFVACPVCSRSFPLHAIEGHAWGCVPSTRQGQGLPVDGAAAERRSPAVGAGEAASPEEKDQSRGRTSNVRGISSSLITPRRSRVKLLPTTTAGIANEPLAEMTVPCTSTTLGDAAQRLMEAGKQARKAERELKTVPTSWPVERIEDILPAEKADSLLASLLHASRSWTSRPWYNVNGTPGLTHNRSCMYRIPTAGATNNSSSSTTTTGIFGIDREQTDPAHATDDDKQRRAGLDAAAVSDMVSDNGGRGGDEVAGVMQRTSECSNDDPLQSSEDESFDYGFPGAREVSDGFVGDSGGDGERSGSARASVRAQRAKRSSLPETEAGKSAEHPWISNDQGAEVAPDELLEIVPRVVEIVRRRQRRRVEEGLGGHEGLGWNPNFCLCNVYDDHRNHLGPHSDTLSSIGPEAIVVGISLGAKRVFMVQEKLPWGVKAPAGSGLEGKKKFLDLSHNSAVVMWGGCQERYKHSVPSMTKGVGVHPMAGTKRISITLRERKENLPRFLLPVPDCRCGAPASLNSRVLENGRVEYLFHCDRARGACGFMLFKGPRR
eukprot:g2145.t1